MDADDNDDEACVFCRIASGTRPADVPFRWDDAFVLVPHDPVVPGGHVLIVANRHVPHAGADPMVTAQSAYRAAELMAADPAAHYNLITSVGSAATQTVPHLHWHLIRRAAGDGLVLPWTRLGR